jgi:(p)ppGpp synthase/HD superfamily hydrolase
MSIFDSKRHRSKGVAGERRSDYTRAMLGRRRMPSFLEPLPTTRAAVSFAQRAHAGQRRKVDGAPFIAHPLEVAALLQSAGAADEVIAAGVLHDVIEKTDVGRQELRERFGARVAGLVVAVSEDERIRAYAPRKAALREQAAAAGEQALTVFAADKVAKARELREHPGAARHARRRVRFYRDCLRLLEERLSRSPLVAELRAELELIARDEASAPALAGAR